MRTFSRIGTIAATSFGLIGFPAVAWARQARDDRHDLSSLSDGSKFSIKEAAGRYLAIHFLTRTDNPECTAFTQDYIRRAPTLAGVRHIFVRPDDVATVKAWSAQFGENADSIFVDADSALAKDLKIPTDLSIGGVTSNYPATVVFGTDGKELFRYVGKAHDDHLPFADFAKQFQDASKLPSISHYNLPKGKTLAVEGYDVVAYFKQSKAIKGKPELSSTYRGVSYQFASEANRRAFAIDPERYLPTYGGWCASAMGAKAEKVEIDPTNFKVKDGRLFLFYRSIFADALTDWNKHEKEWEPAADSNWKKLTNEDPIKPKK